MYELLDGGVHECTRHNFRSFTFFPTEWAVWVFDEMFAVLVDQRKEGTPIVKFVVVDLLP